RSRRPRWPPRGAREHPLGGAAAAAGGGAVPHGRRPEGKAGGVAGHPGRPTAPAPRRGRAVRPPDAGIAGRLDAACRDGSPAGARRAAADRGRRGRPGRCPGCRAPRGAHAGRRVVPGAGAAVPEHPGPALAARQRGQGEEGNGAIRRMLAARGAPYLFRLDRMLVVMLVAMLVIICVQSLRSLAPHPRIY
ncbi:unnamed protein product, partial [Prorocentrum cordatum]